MKFDHISIMHQLFSTFVGSTPGEKKSNWSLHYWIIHWQNRKCLILAINVLNKFLKCDHISQYGSTVMNTWKVTSGYHWNSKVICSIRLQDHKSKQVQASVQTHGIELVWSGLFYSILFYSILIYVLFCSVLFQSVETKIWYFQSISAKYDIFHVHWKVWYFRWNYDILRNAWKIWYL